MGYLGLDETPIKDDNLFQRLFWPSDHAGETDQLGQQGFWVCWAVGSVSFLLMLARGHWLLALLTLLVFGLGGTGIREHSQPAAMLIACIYWLNQLAGVVSGQFPGFLGLVGGVLLIANIRGTYIAAKWAARGDQEVFPERARATLADRFVDQMPLKVWPKAKVPFFALAGLYLALTVLGIVALAVAAGGRHPVPVANDPGGVTVEVAPSR